MPRFSQPTYARLFALALALPLAPSLLACEPEPAVPPATMVPNTTAATGPTALPVLAGGCARLSLCCTQLMAATGAGPQPDCAQIAGAGGNPDADRACDQAARSLAAAATTVRPTPPACGVAVPLGAGGSVSIHGAPSGRVLAVGAGMAVHGTLQSGDSLTSEGSAYDDYLLPMVAGHALTLVARGGPLTAGGGSSTLDMYVTLLQAGAEVTHDDDSAGSLNSRIVYTPPASGVYVIRVSTFGSGLREGSYTLELYDGALPSQT